MKNSKKSYRHPDKLPKLRRSPKIGELLFRQDLDGEVFPLIILSLHETKIKPSTKKGRYTIVKEAKVLQGSLLTMILVSDLKIGKDLLQGLRE
jgi:hypothetical protein